MRRARAAYLAAALVALALCGGSLAGGAQAQGFEDDGGAEWRLDPILPPELPNVEPSQTPIGLGRIGDIEFYEPNRGLLITAGNGSTIRPGVWAYSADPAGQGNRWHELATVCGATDGRIAWAGPEEFWTISDGRPGQAANPKTNAPAPLEDNSLCRFSGGAVVASYAKLAFQADSYQAMHGAGCLSPTDCWFAGDPLEEPQVGAFHLHWNGSTLEAERNPQGHAVQDMRAFDDQLFESVRLAPGDRVEEEESPQHPSVLHAINPEGVQPTFEPLLPESASGQILPAYAAGSFPAALGSLHLSADQDALWAAASPLPASERPEHSAPAEVTVLRYSEGVWSQPLGPEADPPGGDANPFAGDVVTSIAAEPGTEHAWVALDSPGDSESPSPTATVRVARISADGEVTDEVTLPTAQEAADGVGPKGAAAKITCPAAYDCWLATTQGWLFQLSDGGAEAEDTDPAFSHLITERPPDEGVPQVAPDTVPEDDSGLPTSVASSSTGSVLEDLPGPIETRVTVPLLSHIRSRLVHGTTLELGFHLAVKARVRLLAKRRSSVVASTPMRTFAAGNRKLLLRLNAHRWPTKLDLQTHALAALPTASTRGAGNDTVSTQMRVLPHPRSLTGLVG
jgi:hypothetical protein